MGRSQSIIKRCYALLTTLSTRQVLQALKKQLTQNREAGLVLGCTQRANINICMSMSPGWKWKKDWLHHYFYLWEVLTCWMHRAVYLNYWHTARTPMHTPQDMPRNFRRWQKWPPRFAFLGNYAVFSFFYVLFLTLVPQVILGFIPICLPPQ
jgi:hypothetical protein